MENQTNSGKFYEMTGLVHEVGEERTFSSGFRKRELVLTNDVGESAKYPKYVPFAFKKERGDQIKGFRKGQRVKVVFALEGREYNGRYYPEVTGLKATLVGADGAAAQKPAEPTAQPSEAATEESQEELPF